MPIKPVWLASAALLLALPALAQQANVAQPAPAAQPTTPAPATTVTPAESSGDESAVEEVTSVNIPPPIPPVEYPGWARRDPWTVGPLAPEAAGLTEGAWGGANGPFLSTLMRRMRTPLASRWAHIALRDALLAKVRAPVNVNPIDWTAERAWLLLRMGEADAARMLVASVDVDRFTPKMTQVAVQSALATADPAALCPLQDGMRKAEPGVLRLVQAMCAALAGQPESASAAIDQARRYGRIGGIDLALAEKVVGAGANGRTTTIEWEPVDALTAWRFGLSAGTGMAPPDRLINAASPQLRAFQARAPMLTAQQRLPSAMVAAGLGVFSSQSMVDLYSSIYDSTDPDDLPGSDAWQLRLAYIAKDPQARIAAIRKLLGTGKGQYDKEGARALVARAAAMIRPDAKLGNDACDLISAMFAGGYDQAAARWLPVLDGLDDAANDRCWAMLALASPNVAEVTARRVNAFIKRDNSRDHVRSALLVAGLAGLGRLDTDTVNSINRSYGLGVGHDTSWTRMIDAAAARGQGGTVLVLTGTGFQTPAFDRIPAAHLFHSVLALSRTGQSFTARMIAAEALSRT